jgi:hypothetical protein
VGAGAILVVCRLAGLSALEAHYAGVGIAAQSEDRRLGGVKSGAI